MQPEPSAVVPASAGAIALPPSGEAPLLVVADGAGRKFDVPFAEAYLQGVDVRRREVRMNLPQGMLEINASPTAEEKREQAPRKKR